MFHKHIIIILFGKAKLKADRFYLESCFFIIVPYLLLGPLSYNITHEKVCDFFLVYLFVLWEKSVSV